MRKTEKSGNIEFGTGLPDRLRFQGVKHTLKADLPPIRKWTPAGVNIECNRLSAAGFRTYIQNVCSKKIKKMYGKIR